MKIGVYVGSFNPVHKGHMKIVKYLIENNYLDKAIVIPTGAYWDKQNLIDIKNRIHMLKYYENENIIIDTKHNNIPYTYQVLEELSKIYEKEDLHLILGADNIISFSKWKNYEEILKYNLIILNRDSIDIKYYLDELKKFDKYGIINDLPIINISSTMIREKIKNRDYSGLENYIDKEVIDYIKKNGLYGEENE